MTTDFDAIYEHARKVPWTRARPPSKLIELVEKKVIKPCRGLDVGCGEGYTSKYLAEKGFEVTGIDVSARAIEKARVNAPGINFKVFDVTKDDLSELGGPFDFCFEHALLHCLEPQTVRDYIARMAGVLAPGAYYYSTCFNYQAEKSGKPGEKKRVTSSGVVLWFFSLEELREMYAPYFDIIEANDQITIGGHKANYLLMRRK